MAGLTKALDDRMIRIETALATHGERLARIEAKLSDFCRVNGRQGKVSARELATVAGASIGAAVSAAAAVMGVMAGKGP